jgi:transposase-like protein
LKRGEQMSRETLQQHILELHADGKSIDELCEEYDVPKSTLYRWIRKSKNSQPEISEEDIHRIVTRLTTIEEEAKTYKKVLQLLKQAEK